MLSVTVGSLAGALYPLSEKPRCIVISLLVGLNRYLSRLIFEQDMVILKEYLVCGAWSSIC